MQSLLVLITICITISVVVAYNAGPCITPNSENGTCIELHSCDSLYQLIKQNLLTEENTILLRSSHCGFHNRKTLVCCPPIINETTTEPVENLLPSPRVCGTFPEDQIVGGDNYPTHGHEYPWMALIEYTKPMNVKGFHCGGALINDRYVITAAHCINGKNIPKTWELTSVRLGEWKISLEIDCDEEFPDICNPPPLDIGIEQKIPHEDYNPDNRNQINDIALLRLQTTVQYTTVISPICLEINEQLMPTNFLIFVGWGQTINGSVTDIKHRTTVNKFSIEECNIIYNRYNIKLDESQLCAAGIKDFDKFNLDSGGPIININKGVNYLEGVLSFGPLITNNNGWTMVYTKTSSYINWIISNMKK